MEIVDARRWGAPPWTPKRNLLWSAHDARACSWTGCSHIDPCAIPTCAAHRMLVYDRGSDAVPWAHGRFMPVQRTRRQWKLVDGVLPHRPLSETYLCSAQDGRGCAWMGRPPNRPLSETFLCSAQDARGCARMGCHPMNPCAAPACAAHRMHVDARE